MKKIKLFLSVAIFACMTVAGYSVYDTMTMSDTEKLMIANVEALTGSELNPDCPYGCKAGTGGCHCNGYERFMKDGPYN